jgi:predicted  nucleic acid-binding Zn-ribbon protein
MARAARTEAGDASATQRRAEGAERELQSKVATAERERSDLATRVREAEEKMAELESQKRRAERELEEAKGSDSVAVGSSGDEDTAREIRRLKGDAEDIQLRLDRAQRAEKDATERLETGKVQIRQLEDKLRGAETQISSTQNQLSLAVLNQKAASQPQHISSTAGTEHQVIAALTEEKSKLTSQLEGANLEKSRFEAVCCALETQVKQLKLQLEAASVPTSTPAWSAGVAESSPLAANESKSSKSPSSSRRRRDQSLSPEPDRATTKDTRYWLSKVQQERGLLKKARELLAQQKKQAKQVQQQLEADRVVWKRSKETGACNEVLTQVKKILDQRAVDLNSTVRHLRDGERWVHQRERKISSLARAAENLNTNDDKRKDHRHESKSPYSDSSCMSSSPSPGNSPAGSLSPSSTVLSTDDTFSEPLHDLRRIVSTLDDDEMAYLDTDRVRMGDRRREREVSVSLDVQSCIFLTSFQQWKRQTRARIRESLLQVGKTKSVLQNSHYSSFCLIVGFGCRLSPEEIARGFSGGEWSAVSRTSPCASLQNNTLQCSGRMHKHTPHAQCNRCTFLYSPLVVVRH